MFTCVLLEDTSARLQYELGVCKKHFRLGKTYTKLVAQINAGRDEKALTIQGMIVLYHLGAIVSLTNCQNLLTNKFPSSIGGTGFFSTSMWAC